MGAQYQEIKIDSVPCKKTKIKSDGKFKLWCKTQQTANRSLKGTMKTAKLTAHGKAGGAQFQFVSGDELIRFLKQKETNEMLTTDEFLKSGGD